MIATNISLSFLYLDRFSPGIVQRPLGKGDKR